MRACEVIKMIDFLKSVLQLFLLFFALRLFCLLMWMLFK
jgi:hypothetical protein